MDRTWLKKYGWVILLLVAAAMLIFRNTDFVRQFRVVLTMAIVLAAIGIYVSTELISKYWIAVISVLLAAVMLYGNRQFAGTAFDSALQPIDSADKVSAGILSQYPDNNTLILKKQYTIFEWRKQHYRGVMRVFYTNYYSFNIILVIFSALTTISFFLLARKGWDGTGMPLKIALLSFVFITSVFYLFTNVMDNKANVKNNLNGYIAASRQQLQILKDVNMLSADTLKSSRLRDSLIYDNYDFLYNNLQYFFNLDDTKVSNNPLDRLSAKELPAGK